MDNANLLPLNDWVVLTRKPVGIGPYPIFLLLHGWTGDEKSMWIFASGLPQEAIFVAPRGLYPVPGGGFGWRSFEEEQWPHVADFIPAVEKISGLLSPRHFPTGDFSKLNLLGFSEGAAMAFTLLLTYPGLFRSVAGLSGFLPEGAMQLTRNHSLRGKYVFLAHGALDELVPVARAREAVELLENAGAQVTYCEDSVGHKLSASCFRGLEAFFSQKAYS
jgi:phospholipase/carboxylesterase